MSLILLIFGVGAASVGMFIFWLPSHRAGERASNERNAAHFIKTLASAEADFRANDRDGNGVQDFWTADVSGLYSIARLIDREVAEADARPRVPLVSKPIPYHGYYFVAMETDNSEDQDETLRQYTDKKSGKVHHPAKFAFCAYPAEFGVTGRNTFIVNEGNTILWRHTGGDPVIQWPSHEYQRHDWALGD